MKNIVLNISNMNGVDELSPAFDIFDLDEHHLSRMCVLMEKYQSLPMHLADASLVILAEELGHGRILSVDQRDFNTYRWKNQKPFTNLLFPHG